MGGSSNIFQFKQTGQTTCNPLSFSFMDWYAISSGFEEMKNDERYSFYPNIIWQKNIFQ
jgi:hypothetical protein